MNSESQGQFLSAVFSATGALEWEPLLRRTPHGVQPLRGAQLAIDTTLVKTGTMGGPFPRPGNGKGQHQLWPIQVGLGFQPFWLKPFSLEAAVAHARSAVCSSVLLHLGMDSSRGSERLGAGPSRPTISPVAASEGCLKFEASTGADRQPLHQSGKVQARVFHVRRRDTPHLFLAAVQR